MKHLAAYLTVSFLGACAVHQNNPTIPQQSTSQKASAPTIPAPSTTPPQKPIDLQPFAPAEQADISSLVASQNAFAADLYAKLRSQSGNFAVSPASISLAFGMTSAGALGKTEQQLATVFHTALDDEAFHRSYGSLLRRWNSSAKRDYELRVANRLYGEQTMNFRKPFLAITADHYKAELEPVDFINSPEPARKLINQWVKKQTKERIPKLLPEGSLKPNTRLVLANAIYFKGKWKTEFAKQATKPQTFHTNGSTLQTPTMHQTKNFRFMHQDGVRMLEMPYQGDDLAMQLFLPDQRDGLAGLEQKMTAKNLAQWANALRTYEVVVSLPRFKIDPPKPIALRSTLESMGLRRPFVPVLANFRGMAHLGPNEHLYLSNAYHKAFVEVNEEGTEAAAATGVVTGIFTTSVKPRIERVFFTADHPFVFIIRDTKSDAIVFMGRVARPV